MRHTPYNRRQPRHEDPKGSKTSWQPVAKWYGSYMKGKDTFQDEVVFPGALRMLDVKKGGKYLDVACGEGSFAALIAKQGGEVTGIDVASDLIRQAQNKKIRGATFLVGDATNFASRLNPQFDGASCILAIQNIADHAAVMDNVATVLKKGAPFVVVMNHPSFRIPRQSSWGFDEAKKMQYRRVDLYMSEHEIPIQAHPGSAPGVKTLSYHRPLQSSIAALTKAGFVIDGLEEWVSHRESDSGPRARAENRSRNEIPMFMAIRAKRA